MSICHSHNLTRDLTEPNPFGIRISLPVGDSFNRLIGAGWERYHWYSTEAERDAALKDMASEHLHSRRGDRPHVVFTAVKRAKESESG